MPVDSVIYRKLWGGFYNAFNRAGLDLDIPNRP